MVDHICNPSNQEAEAEGSLIWGQPGQQNKTHYLKEEKLGCDLSSMSFKPTDYYHIWAAFDMY